MLESHETEAKYHARNGGRNGNKVRITEAGNKQSRVHPWLIMANPEAAVRHPEG